MQWCLLSSPHYFLPGSSAIYSREKFDTKQKRKIRDMFENNMTMIRENANM
jgi:hypothetical protein